MARPQDLDLGGVPGAARLSFDGDIHCVTRWSKLGTGLAGVSVDTLLEAVEPLPRPARDGPRTAATRPTCRSRTSRRQAWVAYELRRRAAASRARRPGAAARARTCTSGRAPSGSRAASSWTTTSPASGSRSATTTTATLAGAALSGRLSWRLAERRARSGRETPAGVARWSSTSPAGRAPRGPARRRAAHRRGRLPGPAQLLDRLGARRLAGRADRRAARGRRGLAVPGRRAPRGRPAGAARARSAAASSGSRTGAARCCWSRGGSGVVPLMAMLRHRAPRRQRRPGAAAALLAHPRGRDLSARSWSGWRRPATA